MSRPVRYLSPTPTQYSRVLPSVRSVMEAATAVTLRRIDVLDWPEHPKPAQPWDINRGWCVDWAQLVCARVPGATMEEYDACEPTWMLHTAVLYQGRYYDSECLDGVEAITGLPCFAHPWDRGTGPEDG